MTTKYLQHIDYGAPNSPLKVISLHGFPSVRSKQNREIAQGIASELNCRVRVVLYPGLSCDGVFSFAKTIDALISEFPEIAKDSTEPSRRVDLLGHSFGGFSAILIAARFPQLIRRMMLLSPLLRFNSSVNDVTAFFSNILSGCGDSDIKTLSPQGLGIEFHQLSQQYKSEELIAQFDPNLKVKLMQARVDAVTPTAIAEEFRQYFKCDFDFKLVEHDHSFLVDRPKLSREIAQFFK